MLNSNLLHFCENCAPKLDWQEATIGDKLMPRNDVQMRMNFVKNRCSWRRSSQRAFTLAELMVACAILAIMVVSLFGGISFGFSNITIARQNLRATQIALEKMEIVRMYSWEQVNSNGFVPRTFTAPCFPVTNGGDTNGGVVYYGTIIITNVVLSTTY